jgi:hypothetical protein
MSDQLDDFIQKNRDAFDDKEAPEDVWLNISKNIPLLRSAPWYDNLLLWRAAAVIFMAFSIYLLIPKQNDSTESGKVAVREFNDVEAFYNTQISEKVALIEEISKGESDEFSQDFQQLEAMYLVLKEEWKSRPSKKVKDALVLNLLVRINLLNQQLHRIEVEFEDSHDKEKETVKASA